MTSSLSAQGLALPGRLAPTSIEIGSPGLVCLVGPNGSGKTSLLHALGRIGNPAGKVSIDGLDPDRLAPQARKRLLAFLPASRDIAWPLTARDVIALGLPTGRGSEGMAALSTMLDLPELLDRRIDRLSTGERSRVLIARALAPCPRLVLLDEPAANLDPAWQLRLMQGLKALAAGGQAIVAAMHDLDLSLRYADRLVLMEKGRIAAQGDPAEMVANITQLFGVARGEAGWDLVNPPVGPRSSP